ncbi:MAG: cell division protein [Acidiferrobacteraceae bacterium]|nr:cell division protein [Acidiferrobacteraceae bacterium]
MKSLSKSKDIGLSISGRHWFVLTLLLIMMLLLLFRAFSLQVLNNGYLKDRGRASQLSEVAVKPVRGRILDRRGEVLAISTPVDSICADPRVLLPSNEYLDQLADILDLPLSQLRKLLQSRAGAKFVYLRRHLPPETTRVALDLNLPGVFKQREYHRYYPAGPNVGHVLGFTDIDEKGQEGVELAFDRHLSGVEGKKRVLRDARRRIVEDVDSVKPVYDGKDLNLSLDIRLQTAARRYLAEAVYKHEAAGGSALLLDAKTAEVLAMVNLPDYNPNDRRGIKVNNIRNRAVTDLLEPGSTVKPFTMSLALASGSFTPDSPVDTSPGHYKIDGWTIHDIRNFGSLTLSGVLIKSSNVGTAKIAMDMAPEELYRTFRDVGFGQATGVELPGERVGSLPNRKRWRESEHATLAYGYGVAVTPLQLAKAYGILAAGGMSIPITIRKRDRVPIGSRILPADVVTEINMMLEQVVSPEGTARQAMISGYRVAGKTGTVRKLSAQGDYQKDSYLALFAGFAPVSDPRFVLVVLIDEPGLDHYYGGEVAAPVFARIMSDALRLSGIPVDKQPSTQLVFSRQAVDLGA